MNQGQMDGGGAGAKGQGVFSAHGCGELALKGVHVRPQRCDPVAIEDLLHELLFEAGHVGGREIETAPYHVAALQVHEFFDINAALPNDGTHCTLTDGLAPVMWYRDHATIPVTHP